MSDTNNSSDANDKLFPTIRRGRVLIPKLGEQIYIPTCDFFIGGRATVSEIKGHSLSTKKIRFAERPDAVYDWYDLRLIQVDLWKEFGASPARSRNANELALVQARRDAEKAAKEVAKAASEALEREKWLPRRFACLGGAIIDRPVAQGHRRGRNWIAIATYNPLVAGGIDRFWFNRGSGKHVAFIVPKELQVHDVVEFGADYVRGSGFRDPERWYGVVLEVAETHLILEPCRDHMNAFQISAQRRLQKDAV